MGSWAAVLGYAEPSVTPTIRGLRKRGRSGRVGDGLFMVVVLGGVGANNIAGLVV